MRRLALGLAPLVPVGVLVASCGNPAANIGLVMRAPQGLLDTATAVRLNIFDASEATCNAATGHASQIPSGEGTQSFDLDQCGAKWCKEIELDKDGSQKMFAVRVEKGTELAAEGCATA